MPQHFILLLRGYKESRSGVQVDEKGFAGAGQRGCPTNLDGFEQYKLCVAIGQVQSHAALYVRLAALQRAVRLGDHRL